MNNTHSSVLNKVAFLILHGFDKSYRRHSRITRDAQQRFEQAKWQETQKAMKERIAIYERTLADAVGEIYQQVFPHQEYHQFWLDLKIRYQKILSDHPQYELAETFYNSVIGRIFKHQQINDDMMFIMPTRCYLAGLQRHLVVHSFDTSGTVRKMLEDVFNRYHFDIAFQDIQRDLKHLDAALRARLNTGQLASVHTIEMLKSVFYRSKSAYLIGRICMPDETLPFVIPLSVTTKDTPDKSNQIVVEALLTERQDLSVIFSFARSYFMADTQHPAEVVAFLHELLPHKKTFELYIALGLYKHGKTVFYRNFLAHMEDSSDQFAIAPGIRGLVMAVFHLPSYGVVFKIIKDEFPESKKITRQHVKDCYKLVKMTDRVGRMADTHEYVNFRLPRHRVEQALIDELLETCTSSVELTDDEVIIKHLYIERKMTPLNIFLAEQKDPKLITNALNDLGLCIKQIAAAHIFAGDMLHKNFGITRGGRVIFYDYDEICYLTEREFRALPKSDDPYAIDTLSVGPTDVFPEQFEHFIVGKKHLKQELKALHGEIMTAEYWQNMQAQSLKGDVPDFIPYDQTKRFVN